MPESESTVSATDRIRGFPDRARQLGLTTLDIVGIAFRRFSEQGAPEAAAGMAYYALFSLFPMLLFLVALGSLFLDAEIARLQVKSFVNEFLPTAQDLVLGNLDRVVALRGPVGAAAALVLLWSASGFFTILGRHINRAWPGAVRRTFLEGRAVAFVMVGTLAMVLGVWFIYTTGLGILSGLNLPVWKTISAYGSFLHALITKGVPWVFGFVLFLTLYRWVPRVRVTWWEAIIGAAAVTIVWRIATAGFTLWVGSGFTRYRLVYGSLGSLVALMFWIYITSWITLFGAYLSVSIAIVTRHRGT
ncbi:MAG: YihY/virulence factor BrkB family protein [Anaerolineae bacterium]